MRHKIALASVLLGPCLSAGSALHAESAAPEPAAAGPAVVPSSYAAPAGSTPWDAHYADCVSCDDACGTPRPAAFRHDDWRLYGGADYLFIRPHFSEAIGFAEVTQTPDSFQAVGQDLDFDYDDSFRVLAGMSLGETGGGLRFTYTSLTGDTGVDGTAETPGTFLVDPYGNIAGTAVVIDPQSRLFGQPLPGGDRISTHASVDLDIFDIDFVRPLALTAPEWAVNWSAGLRVADVEQFYASTVTAGDLPLAYGDFTVDYTGVGPRLGLRGDRYFGESGFSVFAAGNGSLLVGEYDVRSGNTVFLPATFRAGQQESVTRLIPVLETELGAAYRISENLRLSAGWVFQAWFDMGTSGGKFGGFFAGADDANIMSFDGLMLRAEVGF